MLKIKNMEKKYCLGFTFSISLVIMLSGCRESRALWAGERNLAGKNIDDSKSFQTLVNENQNIYIGPKDTLYLTNIKLRSNITIRIDGTIRNSDKGSKKSVIFHGEGLENVKIFGNGTIDARVIKSSGSLEFSQVIHVCCSKNIDFSVREVAGSNFVESKTPWDTYKVACIQFDSSSNVTVHDITLKNWGREGIFFNSCNKSTVKNIVAYGSDNALTRSWSAIQVGGAEGKSMNNKIQNIKVYNAGASSVGMNSTYSEIRNVYSEGNRYFHGLNLGHPGRPASHTKVRDVVIKNAGINGPNANGMPYNGLTVAGNSKDVKLENISIDGAFNHGIMVSDGSDRVSLKKIRIKNVKGFKLNLQNTNISLQNFNIENFQDAKSSRVYKSRIQLNKKDSKKYERTFPSGIIKKE